MFFFGELRLQISKQNFVLRSTWRRTRRDGLQLFRRGQTGLGPRRPPLRELHFKLHTRTTQTSSGSNP